MLPSLVSNELTESIRRFLRATFPATTRGFLREDGATAIDDLLDTAGAVFKGPYLSIGLPFRTAESSGKLPFRTLNPGFTPYRHQLLAFNRLCGSSPLPTLVATGTGSGKTECFMFPVLDHCAIKQHHGIKAIIIYPMNALATDQARRFAKEIHKRDSLRGKVRVGLFVGDSEKSPDTQMTEDFVITCKKTLRDDPPDILLTNYKMLDYLLIRPKDQPLWRFNDPGILRFLIVDELHTFDGAQGTDLSCLIRRLRDRLDVQDELACVGTSATIGSGDSRNRLTDYASQVFSTSFDGQAIILEDRLKPAEFLEPQSSNEKWPSPDSFLARPPGDFPSTEDYIAAHAQLWLDQAPRGLASPDTKLRTKARIELGEKLLAHPAVHELLHSASTLIDSNQLIEDWKQRLRTSHKAASAMLESLCALISTALSKESEAGGFTSPLVQLRFQMWMRELRRIVATVEERPRLAFADDLPELLDPVHLPVVHCRECYTTGWTSVRKPNDAKLSVDLRAIYQAYFGQSSDTMILLPVKAGDSPLGKGMMRKICCSCGYFAGESTKECPECGDKSKMLQVWTPDMNVTRQFNGAPINQFRNDCPSCGAVSGLSIMGSRSASLSSVLIGQQFASNYNDDHKLIAFSDSVQDAAHRAGFFAARTWRQVIRESIYQAVQQRFAGMSLQQTAENVGAYWREKLGDETFCATFISPNVQWLRDWEELQRNGKLPDGSELADKVNRRFVWEVINAFGLGSRIGRTLERNGKATVAPDLNALELAIDSSLPQLQEEIEELRELTREDLSGFILGLLWRMRTNGAFYHEYLREYLNNNGREYLINKLQFMPGFGKARRPPAFLSIDKISNNFDHIQGKQSTWYKNWFNKTLASDSVMASAAYVQAYTILLQSLSASGLLREHSVKGQSVWSLNTSHWHCVTQLSEISCSICKHLIQIPTSQVPKWEQVSCQRQSCLGHYEQPNTFSHTQLHHKPPVRLVASEHSAVLDADTRKFVEESFKNGHQPWDFNLLSATPTMEMGIDIGDLSTVLLCSVPPAQSNYLQRIGRAGRKDGNAVSITLAAGMPHDLYFYALPEEMMAGDIHPPGIFLQATSVLERQLVAYCFDQWSRSGIAETAIPGTLKVVLNGIENNDTAAFPNNLLGFVVSRRNDLLRNFLSLFPELDKDGQERLQNFLFDEGTTGIAYRLLNRLQLLVQQRKSFRKRIDELKREHDRLKKLPQDEATDEELNSVAEERFGLIRFLSSLNSKQTLNFFTDEGLLPNYAFPEEGVKLHSVIYRRVEKVESTDSESGESKPYDKTTFEFSRPAQAALSELAPENRFYGVGRRVEIDQIDLSVSTAEEWRLCNQCHYVENITTGDTHTCCPRCGSELWRNVSQKQTLLKLKQVFANTNDRDSRIADENDSREPLFFNRQLLVDISHGSSQQAYKITDEALPFGFEYLRSANFREINFGQVNDQGPEIEVAGENTVRPGFRICKHCGKVKKKGRKKNQNHAFSCKLRRDDAVESDDDYHQALYLYRELQSEAIRLALPLAEVVSSDIRLQSLIAALHLGLKNYFHGDVSHLQVTTYSEPTGFSDHRLTYLVILDTVPGGTGYLKELLRDPEHFRQMLQVAYDKLKTCACNENPDQDGCYRCLYAYRESRNLESTSRDAAKDLLKKILDAWDQLEEVDTLDCGDHNALLESELERLFIEKLANAGKNFTLTNHYANGKIGYMFSLPGKDDKPMTWHIEPQVDLGVTDGVAINCRPDFILRPMREIKGLKPIAIFMDGFSYHKQSVASDALKRLAILRSGQYLVWSLNWHDLPKAGAVPNNEVVSWMTQPGNEKATQVFDQIANQTNHKTFLQLSELSQQGPFQWLLAYLSGIESKVEELSWLALSRQFSLLNFSASNLADKIAGHWENIIPEVWKLNQLNGETSSGSRTLHDKPNLSLIASVPQESLKNLDELQHDSAILLYLDDQSPEHPDFELTWRRFWTASSLFQLLGHFCAVSASSANNPIYDDLLLQKPQVAHTEIVDELSEDWAEAIELTTRPDELKEILDFPAPQVGIDLQNSESEVNLEVEWLWLSWKIAFIDGADSETVGQYRKNGWLIITNLESEFHILKEWLALASKGLKQ